jgi:anti-sigma B factor antagonist
MGDFIMDIEIYTRDNYLISLPDIRRIDASNSKQFKDAVTNAVAEEIKVLVIDLSKVDFIDSSGLGTLVSILKSVYGSQELRLCCLNKNIMNMFLMTRMDRVFSIFETREDALA